MHKLKIVTLFLSIVGLLFLVACGSSTEEKIHKHLENAVEVENEFINEEGSIADLETKEQEIYEKIIELPTEEFKQIKELSTQGIENIDKRKELIELEKESFDNSKDEFDKAEELVDDLSEDEAQKQGKEMSAIMIERYEAYSNVYDSYAKVLENEKKLYNLFQDEDAEQEAALDQLDKLNDNYEAVIDANNLFNDKTDEYNKMKKKFYEESELNVEYNDEEQKSE